MPKMHLTAVFDVPDDHRAQSKITAAIDADIERLEAAIREAAGQDVKIASRIVREKKVALPVVMGEA